MKSLCISSSSFLIPQNRAWTELSNIRQLSFGEYGDWDSSLLQKKDSDELAIVLFIDDFIGSQIVSREEAVNVFQGFLTLLKNRLMRTSLLTIVGIAALDDSNAISSSKKRSLKTFVHNTISNDLEKIADNFSNLHMINLDSHFSEFGLARIRDQRNWYFAHSRVSSAGLEITGNAIRDIVLRHDRPPSKVLLLDCDNTLWGGVVGEDGIGGLALGQDGLGQVFLDFQIEIKKIAESGIILCLVSKNNEEDVWEVFEKHSAMILSREDITAWKINWDEKGHNIRELAQELNLSLDSFVFWDDNPLERDKAAKLVSEMHTVDIPSNVYEWPSYLRRLTDFSKSLVTDDDLVKAQQYRIRTDFVRESKNVLDESAYLRSIKLEPTVHAINFSNITRAAQMCSKTNQFNLRTIRYSESQIKFLTEKSEDFCFLVHLKDCYGDHGSVGLVILREVSKKVIFIDNFLISCRALGRYLEEWILAEIIKIARKKGYEHILGEFKTTAKNTVCQTFFSDHNFGTVGESRLQFEKVIGEADQLYISALADVKLDHIEVYDVQ
tara:strand:+ start:2999 stop:4657 length:1659 start_codon:yes stop_codon:yes gene_type:complete